MYTSFFGLNERPFSITPDPRYLFMSERHTEALAHLIYGVRESGGFIQLTGEVGTGKTTLIRSLLQQLPKATDVALILNPQLSRNEFLSTICEELGVPLADTTNSIKTLIKTLNYCLLSNHSKGRRTILIVDEAQNLRVDVLEQVRLLTNLETAKQKLLQIILIGQPELRDLLAGNDMRQLAQRITGRYHLRPLSRRETKAYIDHRLKVAGSVGAIFSNAAKRELYRLSEGVPRRINVIADRALLGAFTREVRQVTPKLLRKAAAEVLDQRVITLSPWYRWLQAAGIAVAIIVIAIGVSWAFANWSGVKSKLGLDQKTIAATTEVVQEPATSEPTSSDTIPTLPDSAMDQTSAIDAPIPAAGLAAILQENQANTTTDAAFATLFELWGAAYTPGSKHACNQAEQHRLYCLFQRGSLSQVRSLDRPVILTLRDYASRRHQVVLSALNDNVATISVTGEVFAIDTAELAEFWFGEYLLLWRPQMDPMRKFSTGTRNESITWLRESLAQIQGEPITPMSSDYFDTVLETRVRNYQRDRRLGVDGVVGHQTQIAINTDLGAADIPRLAQAD
jgi:general secretion pathway protein A